jgi:hypothetical protein
MSKNDLSFQLAQTADKTGHDVVPAEHFLEMPESISRDLLLLVRCGGKLF